MTQFQHPLENNRHRVPRFAPVALALVICLSTLSSGAAQTTGVFIYKGFLTGNEFKSLNEMQRDAYAMGVVDGMLLSPFFTSKKVKDLSTCTTGMTDSQVSAIFSKYLSDHPERWHETAHVLFYGAMLQACPQMGK